MADIACPIQAVKGIWRFEREPNRLYNGGSLPEHLIHFFDTGPYILRTPGFERRIHPGQMVHFFGQEPMEMDILDEPQVFYSVSFSAPEILPTPLEHRVVDVEQPGRDAFTSLYRASLDPDPRQRAAHVYQHLMRILCMLPNVSAIAGTADTVGGKGGEWWELEQVLKEHRLFRPSLSDLVDLSNRSRTTLVRDCRAATGMSPHQRLQARRMSEAKSLLLNSNLTVTQIAGYLGYLRLHEFSREFSGYFRIPPRAMRHREWREPAR